MKEFGRIDLAFIPVNLPYTMSIDMAVNAALMIEPDYLYPYHFGSTKLDELVSKLSGSDINVRVRKF